MPCTIPLVAHIRRNQMKTYIVYAERTILETLEVKATSEEEAIEKALEGDNSGWTTDSDIDWQITNAKEME
jgi:hypothetical protein